METSSPVEHKDTVPTGEAGVGFTMRADGSTGGFVDLGGALYRGDRVFSLRGKYRNKQLARILAAAPDLYEALQDCAAVCAGETSSKGGLIAALERARAALKKARGES